MSDTNKIKPFGRWHVADTEEECDFYLAEQFGDVACEKCVKLYDEAALEAARQEGMRDALTYAGISERYMKDVLVLDLRAKLQVATEALDKIGKGSGYYEDFALWLSDRKMSVMAKEALAKIKGSETP